MQEFDQQSTQQSFQAVQVLVSLIKYAFDVEVNFTLQQCEEEMRAAAEAIAPYKGQKNVSAHIRELSSRYTEFEALAFHLNVLKDWTDEVKAACQKYQPYVRVSPVNFRFPNAHRRYHNCIREAFTQNGMTVIDISVDWPCWTWVVTDAGDLWLHDTSHGGGGEFSLNSRNKK